MTSLLKWAAIIVLGGAFGVWFGLNESSFTLFQSILYISTAVLILSYLVSFVHVIYVLNFTNNMRDVEKYLKKAVKRPFFATMLAIVNGRIEDAQYKVTRVKNKQQQALCLIMIHFENQNIPEASREIDKIRDPKTRCYYQALIAITECEWNKVNELKEKITNKALRHALDAEVSFKRGELSDATNHGQLAISNAAGLQRFTLIKSLERQEKNPARTSYF